MERRGLVLALALTIPLALYGLPYAYAATTSSTYVVFGLNVPDRAAADVHCNSGDYATGGGGRGGSGPLQSTHPERFDGISYVEADTGQPNAWGAWVFSNPVGAEVIVWVVCQTPITVAGIGVPQVGSLYVAIALGAILYFMLSRRFGKRPKIPVQIPS